MVKVSVFQLVDVALILFLGHIEVHLLILFSFKIFFVAIGSGFNKLKVILVKCY